MPAGQVLIRISNCIKSSTSVKCASESVKGVKEHFLEVLFI